MWYTFNLWWRSILIRLHRIVFVSVLSEVNVNSGEKKHVCSAVINSDIKSNHEIWSKVDTQLSCTDLWISIWWKFYSPPAKLRFSLFVRSKSVQSHLTANSFFMRHSSKTTQKYSRYKTICTKVILWFVYLFSLSTLLFFYFHLFTIATHFNSK